MTEWNIDRLLLYPNKALAELNENQKRLEYIKRRAFDRSDRPVYRLEDIQLELEYFGRE